MNADNIAAGLSPFKPESVAFEAGRIMLGRINDLLESGAGFAFETTLSTRSYVSFIGKAQNKGYTVTLLYFWLSSPQLAIKRVAKRVSIGGHNIPNDIIIRRYYRSINNLLNLYLTTCDSWIVIDNCEIHPEVIAKGSVDIGEIITNNDIWETIKIQIDAN